MDTNDLPVKEKLAALIEAGRACNPGMRHLRGQWGDGETSGCAMTFALKAAGLEHRPGWEDRLAGVLGASVSEVKTLAGGVIAMNDERRSPLEAIVEAIREEKLPAYMLPTPNTPGLGSWLQVNPGDFYFPADKGLTITYFGNQWIAWDEAVAAPLKAKVVKEPKTAPAKKVRASAKTGAMWPVPKGCYA